MTNPRAYSLGGAHTGILDPSLCLSSLGGVSWHLDLRALASWLASCPCTQLIEGRCCSWEISRLPSRCAASEMPPLSGNDVDTLSCDSGSSVVSASYVSSLVPSHHLWASKSGRHMLGLAEDYDALCDQIGQGQMLLAEMDLQIREAPGPISQELVTKVTSAMVPEGEGCTGKQEAEAGGRGRRQGGRGASSPGRSGRKGSPEARRAGPLCRLCVVLGGRLLRGVPVLLRCPAPRRPLSVQARIRPSVLQACHVSVCSSPRSPVRPAPSLHAQHG